jgi:hypothetical protein
LQKCQWKLKKKFHVNLAKTALLILAIFFMRMDTENYLYVNGLKLDAKWVHLVSINTNKKRNSQKKKLFQLKTPVKYLVVSLCSNLVKDKQSMLHYQKLQMELKLVVFGQTNRILLLLV